MKATQFFTDEYLARCAQMSPNDIAEFLDDFRKVHGHKNALEQNRDKSKLISLKVPEDLLTSFRTKADLNGVKYQTQIKTLMQNWLCQDRDE